MINDDGVVHTGSLHSVSFMRPAIGWWSPHLRIALLAGKILQVPISSDSGGGGDYNVVNWENTSIGNYQQHSSYKKIRYDWRGGYKANSLHPHSDFIIVVTVMISNDNKSGCGGGGGNGNASSDGGQSLDRRGIYAHIHCS